MTKTSMRLKPDIQQRFGSLQIEWIAFALFLAAYISNIVFYGSSIDLEHIQDLELNQATQYGVDISKRVSIFNQAVVLSLSLFVGFVWLLNRLLQRNSWINRLASDVFFGAAVGLTSIAVQLAGFRDDYLTHIILALLFFRILSYGIGLHNEQLRWFKSASIFALNCVLSFNIFVCIHLLGSKQVGYYFVLIYVLVLSALYFLVWLIRIKIKSFRHLYFILLPISLLPLAIFISIEIQVYWMTRYNVALGYKKILVALLVGITFVISTIYYVKRKGILSSVKKLNTWITYPLAIFLVVILRYYSPFISSTNELFELANPANSILRMHLFNEIPFVDFMSSHLFSEQWYGMLYTLLVGFNGTLDFMSWEFLTVFLQFLICFLLLQKLCNNAFFALVFVACMTWLQDIFFGPVIFAIPLFFAIEKLWARQTIGTYLLCMFLLVFTCIWRLDTGYAGCVAASIYVFISLMLLPDVHLKLKLVFRSFGITLLVGIGLVALIFLLKGADYPFFNHFRSFIHYISGNQTHGRPSIAGGASNLAFKMNHQVFPMIGLIGIAFVLYSLIRGRQSMLLKGTLFLYLLYFANVQRGLVRHGFAEQNEQFLLSTFILASSLLLVYLLKLRTAAQQIGLLFAFTSLFYLSLKVFPADEAPSAFHQTIEAGLINDFPKQLGYYPKQGRILLSKDAQGFPELTAFLNKHLKKQETFFDFSNSPMLYFYCQRRIPGYFNQPLQNTVGEAAQYELIEQIDQESIPVVIYASKPTSYFDAIDNIHNSQRYHLIATYIYKHYIPLKTIEGKEIWIRKNHILAKHVKEKHLTQKQSCYLGQFPYFAQDFYTQHRSSFTSLAVAHPQKNTITIPSCVQQKDQILVSIQTASCARHNQPLHLYLMNKKHESITHLGFTVFRESSKNYLVRISNTAAWYSDTVTALAFRSSDSIQVKKVTFIQDKRFENR